MKRIIAMIFSMIMFMSSCGGGTESSTGDSSADTSSQTVTEEQTEMKIGDLTVAISGINETNPKDGVYIYDNTSAYEAAVISENSLKICVVADKVLYCGTDFVFPETTGFAVVFCGSSMELAPNNAQGATVLLYNTQVKYIPSSYVKIGNLYLEADYFNCSRTAYMPIVIYDSSFYSTSTQTNIWGLEIAVQDGVVTEVNPAAGNSSGNTAIPKNGFVISVNMEHPHYIALSAAKIGDEVTLENTKTAYTYYKSSILGKNLLHEGESCVLYTNQYNKGNQLYSGAFVEYTCDDTGLVTSIRQAEGGNVKIPENGFTVSAVGGKRNELIDKVKVGSYLLTDKYNTSVTLINTPELLAAENADRLALVEKRLTEAKESLDNLEYPQIDELLSTINALKNDAAGECIAISDILDNVQSLLYPSFKLQNRGAWLVTHDTTEADVIKTLEYARDLGLNAIYIDVFNNNYSIYNSSIDGVIKHSDYGSFDALEAYCRLGSEYDIEIHAMVCCFQAGTTLEGYPDGHYVNTFRDKMLLSRKGSNSTVFGESKTYVLDMYDQQIREFQLSVISEIMENYDIDGMQLDYIRFPLPITYSADDGRDDFGYNENTLKGFMQSYNTSVNPLDMTPVHELWDAWCEFRRDIITSFAGLVYEEKERIDSKIWLTVTCFADYVDRQTFIFQDTERMAELGYVDGVYDMIYAEDIDSHTTYSEDLKTRLNENCELTIGLSAMGRLDHEMLKQQNNITARLGCDGVSIFGLAYIKTGGYDAVYETVFRNSSVQTYRYNISVSAGIEGILDSFDNLYEYYDMYDCTALRAALEAIKETADSSTLATAEDRAQYAAKTVTELREICNTLTLDDKITQKIKSDVEFIIGCLSRNS